jgi:hypothetical protein
MVDRANLVMCTPNHCFTPVYFTLLSCFDAPWQFTPILNLRFLIFCVTLIGSLSYITLISDWNIIFNLHLLHLCQHFRNATRAWSKDWLYWYNFLSFMSQMCVCVCIYIYIYTHTHTHTQSQCHLYSYSKIVGYHTELSGKMLYNSLYARKLNLQKIFIVF